MMTQSEENKETKSQRRGADYITRFLHDDKILNTLKGFHGLEKHEY